jgi:hypothetical protein
MVKNNTGFVRILTLLFILLAIPVTLFLGQNVVNYFTQADTPSVDMYFAPSEIALPQIPGTKVILQTGTNKIAFVTTEIVFDPTKVKLSKEVVLTPLLSQLSPVTTMSEANTTGVIKLLLGLSADSIDNPPSGIIEVATLSLVPATSTTNVTTELVINQTNTQIVDSNAAAFATNTQKASVYANYTTPIPVATTIVTPSPRPTASPTPIPVPTPAAAVGLSGEYFNGKNFETSRTTRIDNQIDFDWGRNAPSTNVNRDNFSIRWSGKFIAPESGNYTFYLKSDDGSRLWINEQLVADFWSPARKEKEGTGTIQLVQGNTYTIKVEYYEGNGKANIQLLYSSNTLGKQVVPSQYLRPL